MIPLNIIIDIIIVINTYSNGAGTQSPGSSITKPWDLMDDGVSVLLLLLLLLCCIVTKGFLLSDTATRN